MPEERTKSSARCVNESAACEVCGHFGAVEIGDHLLCTDCYGQTCSSCCPEFGREESDEKSPLVGTAAPVPPWRDPRPRSSGRN